MRDEQTNKQQGKIGLLSFWSVRSWVLQKEEKLCDRVERASPRPLPYAFLGWHPQSIIDNDQQICSLRSIHLKIPSKSWMFRMSPCGTGVSGSSSVLSLFPFQPKILLSFHMLIPDSIHLLTRLGFTPEPDRTVQRYLHTTYLIDWTKFVLYKRYSTLLYYIYLSDINQSFNRSMGCEINDWHKYPMGNNRDHLVGRLTTSTIYSQGRDKAVFYPNIWSKI